MKNVRWRDGLVPGAGLLVLIISFLPWFGSEVRTGSPDATRFELRTASAWQASSWWSAAVALCLAAAGGWLGYRVARGAVPRWVHLALLLPVAAAGLLVAHQWSTIHHFDPTHSIDAASIGLTPFPVSRDPAVGQVTRDHLFFYEDPDLRIDVWFGIYAGCVAMVLLGIALVVSAADVRDDRATGGPPRPPSR